MASHPSNLLDITWYTVSYLQVGITSYINIPWLLFLLSPSVKSNIQSNGYPSLSFYGPVCQPVHILNGCLQNWHCPGILGAITNFVQLRNNLSALKWLVLEICCQNEKDNLKQHQVLRRKCLFWWTESVLPIWLNEGYGLKEQNWTKWNS